MRGSGLGAVFRVPEFRVVWTAELLSIAGDQLARVALAVLVFDRTGSAVWAAVAYALTFLPALVGGVLLSGLADRYPRRRVMIVCDVARAVLVGAMAVPGMPLGVLCVLLFGVMTLSAPFSAARAALLGFTHRVPLPFVVSQNPRPASRAASASAAIRPWYWLPARSKTTFSTPAALARSAIRPPTLRAFSDLSAPGPRRSASIVEADASVRPWTSSMT